MLIVTNRSKTEPNYFTEIRSQYRLQTANAEFRRSDLGTEPLQVVQHAKALFHRDEHRSYAEALQLAHALDARLSNDTKQSISFKAIASVPKFELWLLLHFENVAAPLHRDEVIGTPEPANPQLRKRGAGNIYPDAPGTRTRDVEGPYACPAHHGLRWRGAVHSGRRIGSGSHGAGEVGGL